jgi:hypothetical protein
VFVFRSTARTLVSSKDNITNKNIIPGLSVENIKLYDIDTETIINNYEDIKSENIKSEKHIKIIIIPIKYDNI